MEFIDLTASSRSPHLTMFPTRDSQELPELDGVENERT